MGDELDREMSERAVIRLSPETVVAVSGREEEEEEEEEGAEERGESMVRRGGQRYWSRW